MGPWCPAVVVALAFVSTWGTISALSPDRDLIGWLGDTYKGGASTSDADSGMVVLSWKPRSERDMRGAAWQHTA